MTVDQLQLIIEDYVGRLPEGASRVAYGFPCFFARDRVFGLYDGDALVLKFDPSTASQLIEAEFGSHFRHAATAAGKLWVRINLGKVWSEEVLETLIQQSYDFVLESM